VDGNAGQDVGLDLVAQQLPQRGLVAFASPLARPGSSAHRSLRARPSTSVVEGAIVLLHWFRRLRICWEIRDDIHHAFVTHRATEVDGRPP
jgi:hypothetical protein